ncbi:flavin monoamine oxidase family protein [Thermomonas sp.]|uniref:flavin monoamine oxidase family protein n=1 Tax=Thermomonas sp. TaxID=1971895 RepID=UPI0035B477CA
MTPVRVAIIGGGLAGLSAAAQLAAVGITDCLLLEARDRLGGRILSVSADGFDREEAAQVDLGPTWFWPAFQPELDALVEALGLARFAQPGQGDGLVERSASLPPMRYPGGIGMADAFRLRGGMGALVEALRGRIDAAKVVTSVAVRALRRTQAGVEIEGLDAAGRGVCWQAAHVLLAVPPRVAEAAIAFTPALPPALAAAWRATPTWMAPHAKYVAVFDRPFWREAGLSGMAQSAVGPLAEIHDASQPDGVAALFGFVGVPALARRAIPADVLRADCRAQLVRLFGAAAGAPRAEYLEDWATDPRTATPADLAGPADHVLAPDASAVDGPWRDALIGIASEWSPQFPGYLAGAIEAARLGTERFLRVAAV